MAKTRYIVLEELEGDSWQPIARNVEATSATGAIRAAVKLDGGNGGTYNAIPMRSWNPQPVTVETQKRLRIG